MSDIRTPPRPPFEAAPRQKRADGKLHPVCPICGIVRPKGRGWWHPECAELWRYAAFPADGLSLLIKAHGYGCWSCGRVWLDLREMVWRGRLTIVRPELEHVRPLWSLTAEERRQIRWWLPFNLQLLCRACHKAKSAREARERYDAQNPDTAAVRRRRDVARLFDDGQLTLVDVSA